MDVFVQAKAVFLSYSGQKAGAERFEIVSGDRILFQQTRENHGIFYETRPRTAFTN